MTRQSSRSFWHVVVSVTLLSACTVGPDYHRPAVAVPAQYSEVPHGWKIAQPFDQTDRGAWWSIYRDPQLDALMGRLNAANQTIAQYSAAYQQAHALVAQARAAYFPIASLSGSTKRSFVAPTTAVSSHSTSFDASWEPDLWGRVRKTVSAQRAEADGAAADLANAKLSVQAALAMTYYQLQAVDSMQQILRDMVLLYEHMLRLTERQYQSGAIVRSDVLLAETQLQSVQAAEISNKLARTQYQHAIATLVGEPASAFSLEFTPLASTPPIIPVGVPSTLLERRPDVAAAERRVAQANEQIGVAASAYFPNFTLSATGGLQSSLWSELFTLPSRFWTVGPQLAATLFDAGLRSARTEAARAAHDQSVAAYRATVLSAIQDVEDNLASQRILGQLAAIQLKTVESAQTALSTSLAQFKAGQIGYLNVILSQSSVLNAKQQLVSVAEQRMVTSVGLIKALGGGFTGSSPEQDTPLNQSPNFPL